MTAKRDPRPHRQAELQRRDQAEELIRKGLRRSPDIVTSRLYARVTDEGALCRGCLERVRRGDRVVVEEDFNCYGRNRLKHWHSHCTAKAAEREVARFVRDRKRRPPAPIDDLVEKTVSDFLERRESRLRNAPAGDDDDPIPAV